MASELVQIVRFVSREAFDRRLLRSSHSIESSNSCGKSLSQSFVAASLLASTLVAIADWFNLIRVDPLSSIFNVTTPSATETTVP